MTQTALLIGGLAFNRPRRETGRYLTWASFKAKTGTAPMAWDHWTGDSYIFANDAHWFLLADALTVMHTLDLSRPPEREILALARAGKLQLSYGMGSSPDETRAILAAHAGRGIGPRPAKLPLKDEQIDHWSYTTEAAFPQRPIQVIAEF